MVFSSVVLPEPEAAHHRNESARARWRSACIVERELLPARDRTLLARFDGDDRLTHREPMLSSARLR